MIAVVSFSQYKTWSQDTPKKIEETTFKVNGVCEMCKHRIENALDVKGVKFSEWNEKTHQCTVVYKPKLISNATIHQLVAKAGHDTDSVKAAEDTYNNLHHCCKYRK